mgnify:CR=1 FL=1
MDVYVRPGDSFWYYSQLFRIPLQLIINSNRNVDPQTIQQGQRIQIPAYVAQNYQIKSGDSLWSIAMSRNLPLDTLFFFFSNLKSKKIKNCLNF